MEVRLRAYREADLEAIVALDAACFAAEFLFDRESMREFAEAQNAVSVVAETAGEALAGLCIVHLEQAGRAVMGYVMTLDVAEAFRRQGLAGQLMDAAEARAGSAGAAWMELHVFRGNTPAVRFYERRGYARTGLEGDFYGPTMDAYVYRKELDRPPKREPV